MKNFIVLFLMLFVFLISGCNVLPTAEDGKLSVVTTIFPLSDIVSRLGGDAVSVKSLIPSGTSPHLYEPLPSDIQTLNNADLVVMVGAGFDDWIKEMMKNSGIDEAKIMNLSDFVSLQNFPGDSAQPQEGEIVIDADSEKVDPHYWVSPKRVLEFLDDLKDRLKEIDSDNSGVYEGRFDSYNNEITALDQELNEKISGFGKKDIVLLHDAFGYLARDYGLNIVATIEPVTGGEPTVSDIENVVAKIKELDIKVIFAEPEMSKKMAETIAEDAQVVVADLDPLGGIEARLTYVSIVKYNLLQLAKYLK